MLIKTIDQEYTPGRTHSYEYIRIDRGDTYSMDVTLAKIVYPMLLTMQRYKHGVPSEFIPATHGPQYSFDFIDENNDVEHESAGEIWTKIVEKMIFSFREIAQGSYLGSDLRMSSGDRLAYYERIQEGLNLFAKHYFSLWT